MAFLKRTKIGEKTYVYIVKNVYNRGKSDQIILARLGIESELKRCFGMEFAELQEELKSNQNDDYYARMEALYIDFKIRKKNGRARALIEPVDAFDDEEGFVAQNRGA